MSELNFYCVDNEEYKTKSVYVEDAIINIKEEDYKIINRTKTKFGYVKANIKILNDDLKNKLKIWEEQINEYLKNEVGTGAITILYGNRIYPKVSGLIGQDKEEIQLNMIRVNRCLKTKVNELVDGCLLYIRILYDLLNDFLFMETHLWESDLI